MPINRMVPNPVGRKEKGLLANSSGFRTFLFIVHKRRVHGQICYGALSGLYLRSSLTIDD